MNAEVQAQGQHVSLPPISGSLSDTLSAFYGTGVTQIRRNMSDLAPDILSASTYPGVPTSSGVSERNPQRKSSQANYGGYVAEDEHISTPANLSRGHVDDNPSPKKRPRRSPKSDEEDSKRQRGRPRLDTQDETAADRRRTQIRLAQRAYRHRKETTISALKKRVGELERTIEKMNKTFLEFHDNAIDSGLVLSKPSLAQQLKATTAEFVSLAKLASIDSDHEEEAANIAELERSNKTESSPNKLDYQNFGQSEDPAGDQYTLGFGFTFNGNDGSDAEVEELPQYIPTDTSISGALIETNDSLKEWSFLNNYQQLNAEVHIPTFNFENLLPPIQKPLKASVPYTYSFQETTFARRLHRLCLERAFRVLTNPDIDPEFIKRAFRFTFTFSNRRRMLARFQELLKRKAGESLENWNVPFFHIGGAGTHFPRLDAQGRPIYPPNIFPPARAFGPLALPTAEAPRDEATIEQLLESIGFGGVWFDSHDVEGYLRAKGIHLDGQSSFVEIDPLAIERTPPLLLHSSSSATSSTSGASPIRSPATPIQNTPQQVTDASYFQELPDPYGSDSLLFSLRDKPLEDDVTFGGAGNSRADGQRWPSLPPSPGHTPSFQEMLQRTPRPVTVDVSKLLERIVDGSACLGRAPGFRRKDVDNALVMALQEAF
jgi:hypothetical protein